MAQRHDINLLSPAIQHKKIIIRLSSYNHINFKEIYLYKQKGFHDNRR